MGAASVRFTEEDFLTPPEFADRRPSARPAGQLGGARLEFIHSGGRTRLGDCYAQIPLLALPPFHADGEPAALQYLLNPTVGLLDGDAHRIEITARAGSRVVVTGQSASRIHPAQASYATQQWSLRVEDGAEAVILPGPAIPFRASRYYQRVEAEISGAGRLIWGDIWLAGRCLSDPPEAFEFERLVQECWFRRNGRLVYRDRFDWRGAWDGEARAWHFGGALACAALFVTGPLLAGGAPLEGSVRRAVLPLASGDTCVRLHGEPEQVIWECVRLALETAGRWSGEAPWLIGRNHFAPNHWFSPPPSSQG